MPSCLCKTPQRKEAPSKLKMSCTSSARLQLKQKGVWRVYLAKIKIKKAAEGKSRCPDGSSNKAALHRSRGWVLKKPSYQKADALTWGHTPLPGCFQLLPFLPAPHISFSLTCCHGDVLAPKAMQRWRKRILLFLALQSRSIPPYWKLKSLLWKPIQRCCLTEQQHRAIAVHWVHAVH